MRADTFIDSVQTTGIIVCALALVYLILRIEREVRSWTRTLADVNRQLKDQSGQPDAAMLDSLNKIWTRINAIEANAGGSQTVRDWLGVAWQHIVKIEHRLDALEQGEPPPKGTRPTDPPLP